MEELSEAVIRGLKDADNKDYIGYSLATVETRAQRAREEEEQQQEESDESYDFKLIREYNWNRKDKSMKDFEENYFLSVKDDSIVYNELETRVRLTKRRPAGGGSKVANVRLIQRYRPFLESEEKIQKTLESFDNEEELEAVNEEENEEEGGGEQYGGEEEEEEQDTEGQQHEDEEDELEEQNDD